MKEVFTVMFSDSCLFADNDFPAETGGFVGRKINDKKKKEYTGLRKYAYLTSDVDVQLISISRNRQTLTYIRVLG